ncbi:MAG: hypothetical protein LAT53_05865 [Idiomarina sp.]|nr:hypothetical protein [Idiomarina sp.]
MNSEDISQIIEEELDSYSYDVPEPGTTLGRPWSEEKVLSYIPKLRESLVIPYLRKFRLSETHEHFNKEVFEDYWVVAIDGGYIQWYDPKNKEFGLGTEGTDGEFISIGVRGDLVGVYCAM